MDYGLLLYRYGIDKCVTYDHAQLTWCNTVFTLSIKYSHIALCGVLTVVECLWCCPLNRQPFSLPELVHVVLSVPH